jgi:hypothetical protein
VSDKTNSGKTSILVFHAKDATSVAYKIQEALQKSGFQAVTLEAYASAQKAASLGDLYTAAVNNHEHVICVVSNGLFANCYMAYAIGRAFGQGKVISATNPKQNVILPTWYKSALNNPAKNFTEVIIFLKLAE